MNSKANPGHQPARFQVFTPLADGKSFKVEGCSFVFKLDKKKGWFDQYGNYYNQDGEPKSPPSEQSSDIDDSNHSDGSDHGDEFEKQFGRPRDDSSEDESSRFFEIIAKNRINLEGYPANIPLRVNFSNVPYRLRKDDIMGIFKTQVDSVVNINFNKNERGQNNGSGWMVVSNLKAAEALVDLEGQLIDGREIRFDVDEYQYLTMHPITQEELGIVPSRQFYNSKLTKEEPSAATKEEPVKKVEQPKKVEPKKVEAKQVEQSKKVEQAKKVESQIFKKYIFEKVVFSQKVDFQNWMREMNLFIGVDYRNPVRVSVKQGEKVTHATVEMSQKAYKLAQGSSFKGVRIHFELI